MAQILLLVLGFSASHSLDFPNLRTKPERQRNLVAVSWENFPGATNNLHLESQAILSRNENEAWVAQSQLKTFEPGIVQLPAVFWDPQIGGFFSRHFDSSKFWALSTTVGSPSDKPFSSTDVLSAQANAYYGLESSTQSSWSFILNYSNARGFLNHLPLPGFAYSYYPHKKIVWTLGFPFLMMRWFPDDRWQLALSTFVPWQYKAELSYRIFGPLFFMGNLEQAQSFYLVSNRTDRSTRLFHRRTTGALGLRSPIAKNITLQFWASRYFRRELYEGQSPWKRGGTNFDLPKDWSISLLLRWANPSRT